MRKRSLKFIYIEIFKPKQEDNEPIIFSDRYDFRRIQTVAFKWICD